MTRVHVLKIWSPRRSYRDVGETSGFEHIWQLKVRLVWIEKTKQKNVSVRDQTKLKH